MKAIKYVCTVIISTVLMLACSTPVHVEKDNSVSLSNYKTYMWVQTMYNQNDESKRPASYGDITVRNAANAEFARLGWREVETNPDVLVSYDVLVQSTTARKSDPVYSQSYSRTYYNPRLRRWGTIYYPSQFLGYNNYEVPVNEGTITITLTDANSDKMVWQGWTTDGLNYSRITQEEITSSVRNIFSKLDVSK